MSSIPVECGNLRPDLVVPSPPDGPVLTAVRRLLATAPTSTFARAQRRNLLLVTISAAFVVAGQFAFISVLRDPAIIGGEVLVTYGAMRAALLTILRQRQYRFEPTWLARQSAVLREGEFQVIRFRLDERIYDLGNPDMVRELLQRIDEGDRVVLDIAYAPSAFERTYPHLRNVRYRTVLPAGSIPRAQFPQAHYGLRPSGIATFWVLGDLVILTVAVPGDPAMLHDGIDSRVRFGGEPRADEHPPGMT